ncbi:hypothetical protein [Kitasatospora sp. NPDC057223]|uniref:hypothetical protein n=1 Tax=Kitasatospora sp. NPDC057223 TaxID=3346055 RepID=UPI003633B57B
MTLPTPADTCPLHGVPDNCGEAVALYLAKAAEQRPAEQPRTVIIQQASSVPAFARPADPRVEEARAANQASLRNAAWVVGGILALIVALTAVKLLGWINLSVPTGNQPQPAVTVTVTPQ